MTMSRLSFRGTGAASKAILGPNKISPVSLSLEGLQRPPAKAIGQAHSHMKQQPTDSSKFFIGEQPMLAFSSSCNHHCTGLFLPHSYKQLQASITKNERPAL